MSTSHHNGAGSEDKSAVALSPIPQISWGAIFAGLTLIIASAWLMMLLGSAISISIADASDSSILSKGHAIFAGVWALITALVCFFLGSLLTARLAGSSDETVGLLHGITLWSLATLLMLLISYCGIAQLMNTGASLVSTAADLTTSTIAGAADAATTATVESAQAVEWSADRLADTELADSIGAKLKQRAADLVADAPETNTSQQEVKRAINDLESEELQEVASELIAGNTEAAREKLAEATNLSEDQVSSLVDGLEKSIDDSTAMDQVRSTLNSLASSTANQVGSLGGESVSSSEVREAIRELDAETLRKVAVKLINGNTEAAKDVIAVETTLNEDEINSIVDGLDQEIESQIEDFQESAAAAMETTSDYTLTALWSTFLSSCLGLAVSIGGGWVGAKNAHRKVAITA